MPGGDRTGPMGMGPMTGRGAGFCAGAAAPGFMGGFGRGWFHGMGRGRGPGFGRGWRCYGAYPNPGFAPFWGPANSPEQETELLRNQAQMLSDELKRIQDRISEIEAGAKSKGK